MDLFGFFRRRNKRHWYEVTFVYKRKNGHKLFDFRVQVGFKDQQSILDIRHIKKVIPPLHIYLPSLKGGASVVPLLCSGRLAVEIECYLGYFDGDGDKKRGAKQ